MGLIEKIANMFSSQLDAETEQSIASRLDAFQLAVSRLSESYTSKAGAEEFAQQWEPFYKEVKTVRISKKHKLYELSLP